MMKGLEIFKKEYWYWILIAFFDLNKSNVLWSNIFVVPIYRGYRSNEEISITGMIWEKLNVGSESESLFIILFINIEGKMYVMLNRCKIVITKTPDLIRWH